MWHQRNQKKQKVKRKSQVKKKYEIKKAGDRNQDKRFKIQNPMSKTQTEIRIGLEIKFWILDIGFWFFVPALVP
jgi:hypothetical protein